MTKGWQKESARHALAAKGVKTKQRKTTGFAHPITGQFKLSRSVEKELINLAKHNNEYAGAISADGAELIGPVEEGGQMIGPNVENIEGDVIFHTHGTHNDENLDIGVGWSLLDYATFYRLPAEKFILAEQDSIFVLEKGDKQPSDKEIWGAWFTAIRKKNRYKSTEFVPLAMTFMGPPDEARILAVEMSKNVEDEFTKVFGMKARRYRVT